MQVFLCPDPPSAVIATDENQARVLLRLRLKERGIRRRSLDLYQVDSSAAQVLIPLSREIQVDYAQQARASSSSR